MPDTASSQPARRGVDVIKDNLKRLPAKPGVYRMFGAKDEVLYVGKARNLKARVSNYARLGGHTQRIAAMIALTAAYASLMRPFHTFPRLAVTFRTVSTPTSDAVPSAWDSCGSGDDGADFFFPAGAFGPGADAASRIEASGASRPDVLELDLADLRSVDAFATAFAAKHGRCDVLMNNAGVMALPERALSLDGIEMQMATNHMGHFYLTCAMMPSILAAPGRPRVVNLSSVAHEWGHVDFENVNSEGFLGYPASGWLTYGRTKLANLYFTYELHRRLRLAPGASERGTDRVDVNAVHPGIVDTDLPRSLLLNFYPALKRSGGLITPEQGVRGQIAAAIDDAFYDVSGKYIAEQSGPRGSGGAGVKGAFEVSESSKYSYDAEAAARFWKVSKAMTGAAWEVLGEKKEPKIIY